MVTKRMMYKEKWKFLRSVKQFLKSETLNDEIQFIKFYMEILCTIGKDKMQQCAIVGKSWKFQEYLSQHEAKLQYQSNAMYTFA